MSSSPFRLKLLCAAVAVISASCASYDPPITLPEGQWEMTTSSFIDIGRMPGIARATLLIRDGRISAFSGCNTGTGAVSSVDGKMVATPLAVTRRACIEPISSFEGRYFKLLQGKPYFRTEGDALILAAGDDSARFRRSPAKAAEKPVAKPQT